MRIAVGDSETSQTMPSSAKQRIAYIDWLRGFACLGMFEVHCYDSWLGGAARDSHFYKLTQFSGSIPAGLFVFLAGISFALVTDKLRRKGVSANQIASKTIRRGAEIFALGLLFRVQEFALGWPKAPWTDLLRVDILNLIGASLILMGVLCRVAKTRKINGILAAIIAIGIALLTPLLWTTWRPRRLPWFLESYVNGVHIYGVPQHWLFPLFPWSGFAFAGLAVGFFLFSDWGAKNVAGGSAAVGGAGVAIFFLSLWLDSMHTRIYPVYDYWHTSPNYFLARAGIIMFLMLAAYAWCRWGPAKFGFSPCIQLGQTSLLVYWVHIEFVYGRFSILKKQAQTIPTATLGLAVIFIAMLLLSMARTRFKGRGAEILASFRRVLRPATET